MQKRQTFSLFLLLTFLLAFYFLGRILAPFFDVLFWTGIICFIFYPVYRALRRLLKGRENFAAALMTSLVFLVVLPLFGIVFFKLIEELMLFSQRAGEYFQSDAFPRDLDRLLSHPMVRQAESTVIQWKELAGQMQERAVSWAGKLGGFAARFTAKTAQGIFVFSFKLFIGTVVLFFFFRDGERIIRSIKENLPMESEDKDTLFLRLRETFKALIHGQLMIAFVKAGLLGITFLVLGLPFALLLSFLAFFISLIPMIGSPVIWGPAVIILALAQELTRAVILLAVGVLVITPADDLLFPYLVGRKMQLNYLWLLLGVLGGLAALGIRGVFLGPLIFSLFFVLLGIARKHFWPEGPVSVGGGKGLPAEEPD